VAHARFGGNFLTKARRYSVTFAALRAARVTYRRSQESCPEYDQQRFDRQDDVDDETTLVIGRLAYARTGWKTTGDVPWLTPPLIKPANGKRLHVKNSPINSPPCRLMMWTSGWRATPNRSAPARCKS
jgi:hypothetical protein